MGNFLRRLATAGFRAFGGLAGLRLATFRMDLAAVLDRALVGALVRGVLFTGARIPALWSFASASANDCCISATAALTLLYCLRATCTNRFASLRRRLAC